MHLSFLSKASVTGNKESLRLCVFMRGIEECWGCLQAIRETSNLS